MRIVIVIPARMKSSRFPGKPLADIDGKTLIKRVWERCIGLLSPEDVYIATDSSEIQDHCLDFRAQAVMTSEACLTGTDRVYEASLQIDADVIINVQGDEPLISPNDIQSVISAYMDDNSKVYCGMAPIKNEEDFRSSSVPKVVVGKTNNLIYMSRAAIPTTKKLEFIKAMRQVCIYAFPKDALYRFGEYGKKGELEAIEDIEILRFFEIGYNIQMVEVSGESVAVDFPEDIDRVIKLL